MFIPLSPRAAELKKKVTAFMDANVYAAEPVYARQLNEQGDRWKSPAIMDELKKKARAEGLWNIFLAKAEHKEGLSNYEYGQICEVMGRSPIGPESFNCSAPDTGNMETILRYGTKEHHKEWLEPLLDAKIRSCFAMTEPAVASSDATNIQSEIKRDGDHYVINGRKWYTTNATDPRCK